MDLGNDLYEFLITNRIAFAEIKVTANNEINGMILKLKNLVEKSLWVFLCEVSIFVLIILLTF